MKALATMRPARGGNKYMHLATSRQPKGRPSGMGFPTFLLECREENVRATQLEIGESRRPRWTLSSLLIALPSQIFTVRCCAHANASRLTTTCWFLRDAQSYLPGSPRMLVLWLPVGTLYRQ